MAGDQKREQLAAAEFELPATAAGRLKLLTAWLPWTPGKKAVQRMTKNLVDHWGWRRVRGQPGVLETDEPSYTKPGSGRSWPRWPRITGVTEDEILAPMVAEIEKEVRARQVKWEREHREAQVARVETRGIEDPWWLSADRKKPLTDGDR